MLDYKLLEALVVVIQEGGFDKASRVLNLTQSAVSQRIKQLEEQTGQIVIARTNPPKATPAGQKMIKHYLQVKRLEDDLFDTVISGSKKEYTTLAIGTNRDCLATWLQTAIQEFLRKQRVVLEFRAADQEQTHQLMKNGDVIGCISVKDQPMQGCRLEFIGRMKYWMVAGPEFNRKWFRNGLTDVAVAEAPLILFDRKDEMHTLFFQQVLKSIPAGLPTHYVPSTKTYTDFITSGLAYGLLPEQECGPLLKSGKLTNVSPNNPVYVDLYWHCWNIKSHLLDAFTGELVSKAKRLLL